MTKYDTFKVSILPLADAVEAKALNIKFSYYSSL